VLVAATAFAAPLQLVVPASADALLRSVEPTLNYGLGGGLGASGSAALNATGEQMGLLDALIRFDTAATVALFDAAFPGGWDIQSAVLRINEQARPNNAMYNQGQGDFEVLWLADDSWVEGTGTPKTPTTDGVSYGDLPALLGPLDESLGTYPNNGPNAADDFIDIFCSLSLASNFIDDIKNSGLLTFRLTAASDTLGLQFAAMQNKDDTSWPYLTLTADEAVVEPRVVPEPATLSLLGLGLAGCLRRRRRPRCA